MEDASEDMLDGTCCAVCRHYFADDASIKIIRKGRDSAGAKFYTHGYPVACRSCWNEDSLYQRAVVGTI